MQIGEHGQSHFYAALVWGSCIKSQSDEEANNSEN